MPLKIYNTLTRQKEEFEPREHPRVTMYVCGPNLYGPAHIGHALSYIIFDTIKRYLKFRGYQVRHVQNFTDIEDRIIETAKKQNTTLEALAEKYIARFLDEMDQLNVQRADAYPRATQAIPTIIKMTEGLLANGSAYRVDGDVYFRVRADEDYGKLSHRTLDELESGARVAIDERKNDPLDFALWKAAKPGEPVWSSPWGPGRPGWHIECSAMNLDLNGAQIDLHGGGQDVIFPHHENEIAQSESFTGKVPFARYWVHNALLHLPGSEKMTRHEGGLVLIPEALAKHSADAIRAFILNTHYRTPLAWGDEDVDAVERGLERLRAAVADLSPTDAGSPNATSANEMMPLTSPPPAPESENVPAHLGNEARQRFIAAMDDDFNTPMALGVLYDLAREINRGRQEGATLAALAPAQQTLRGLADVFGLSLREPTHAVSAVESAKIEVLIQKRDDLRAAKRFAEADFIRAELASMDIVLEDTPRGTKWKKTR